MNLDESGMQRDDLERLQLLLDKYANGQCTPDEQRMVEAWYESIAGEQEATAEEELEAKKKIWEAINVGEPDAPAEENSSGYGHWWKWAAVITLVGAVGVFLLTTRFSKHDLSEAAIAGSDIVTMTNDGSKAITLTLADGSTIELQPHAEVKYPKTFNGPERVVAFSGEGFFNIQRDPTHPFKVLTGNVVTRVLGTSFMIKTDARASVIEVDVRTGSVSVYKNEGKMGSENVGVMLTANQRVTYHESDGEWLTGLVPNPLPVQAADMPAMVYKDESIRTVIEHLTKVYHTEFFVDNDALYNCPFTGDVSNLGLHSALRVICRSIAAQYEVKGTRVLISGRGCAPVSK